MLASEIPHPTAPRWLTLSIAMRVCERALLALTFLWVLALVGWPERRVWLGHALCIYDGESLLDDLGHTACRRSFAEGIPWADVPHTAVSRGFLVDTDPLEFSALLLGHPVYHRDASLRVLVDALTE